LSEEIYRRIVEGSNDIIFSLDESWNIITINEAVKEYLKVKPDALHRKNLFDLIQEDISGKEFSKELIKNKLEIFLKEKTPVQFKDEFKLPHLIETKTMKVRLEYLDIEGKQEIFAKTTPSEEDTIQKYIVKERLMFEVGNSLITAEEVSFRLTNIL
jgi:PAS domain-containing protein